jgi:hypothetical protein
MSFGTGQRRCDGHLDAVVLEFGEMILRPQWNMIWSVEMAPRAAAQFGFVPNNEIQALYLSSLE